MTFTRTILICFLGVLVAFLVIWRVQIGRAEQAQDKYRQQLCVNRMATICIGVDIYTSTYGSVPGMLAGKLSYHDLASSLLSENPHEIRFLPDDFTDLESVTHDPWGREYSFRLEKVDEGFLFKVRSDGVNPNNEADDLACGRMLVGLRAENEGGWGSDPFK